MFSPENLTKYRTGNSKLVIYLPLAGGNDEILENIQSSQVNFEEVRKF